jgi:hypothetical protein
LKVKDWIARFSDEFMDLEVAGVIVVGVAKHAPMVISTMRPDRAKMLLDLCVNHGDWESIKKIETH